MICSIDLQVIYSCRIICYLSTQLAALSDACVWCNGFASDLLSVLGKDVPSLHRRSVDVLSFVVCWLQPGFSHERAYDRELCKERWTLVLDANAYLSFRLFSRLISTTTSFKERLLGRSVVSKALSLRMLDAFGWLCATTISLIVVIFHIQQVPSKLCLLRLF